MLRAVLYQPSDSTWEQSFTVDGRSAGSCRYRPETQATVWVTIPRELYREDFGVTLDIDRVSGEYASVAQLRLYEVYPYLMEGREGNLPVAEPRDRLLDVVGANPFRTKAVLSYRIPTAQRATLRVFDIQGRMVRELASGVLQPGRYAMSWDGSDEADRKVSAGAYFIELKTESSGATRKVIYAP